MRNKPRSRGFSLLEVLVALAIIAIALLALMSAMNHSVQGLSKIEMKITAHTVAMNIIGLLQSGVLSYDVNNFLEPLTGQEWLRGIAWHWEAVASDFPLVPSHYHQVCITVHPIADLTFSEMLCGII